MPKSSSEAAADLAALVDELPPELARQALTHASWVEHRAESYERLAFLGDVVLSLSVSTHLFPRHEGYGAGRLTKVRAQAVSGAACAEVALAIEVPQRLAANVPADAPRSMAVLAASERVLASVDYKSLLQERLARRAEVVEYRIASAGGPAHDRRFEAVAEVGGREIGRGEGRSKKAAEQEAALVALDGLPGAP